MLFAWVNAQGVIESEAIGRKKGTIFLRLLRKLTTVVKLFKVRLMLTQVQDDHPLSNQPWVENFFL